MRLIDEGQLSMDEIAEQCRMSRASFYNKFKAVTGISPRKYRELGNFRRARYLLTATTIPLTEIARQCGFEDYSYFSNRFMAVYGERPSTRRKQTA
jgi:AraC family transcriptional regulator